MPRNCAHLVNCVYKSQLRPNAAWGYMTVDDKFCELFPDLEAKIDERYPAIRIARDIKPGEEILLNSYGASYWIHRQKEKASKNSIRSKVLPPQLLELLESYNDRHGRSKRRAVVR
jgi:hypothetical protein